MKKVSDDNCTNCYWLQLLLSGARDSRFVLAGTIKACRRCENFDAREIQPVNRTDFVAFGN